jgi:predicted 3-demethylubiquinone-9 3-methyltransferase (glyoxalase superfamily)
VQPISPFLWFDRQAEEAVAFYCSVFERSRVGSIARYGKSASEVSGQPEGAVMTIDFELEGQVFTALNGGPLFQFTPAVSFFVNGASREEVDRLWGRLSDGGTSLMELDEYPFSPRYGFLKDRFGIAWQLILPAADPGHGQKIVPSLLFVGDACGRAEEAIDFYTAAFRGLSGASRVLSVSRYGAGQPGREGTVAHALFELRGHILAAMDGPGEHEFGFTPAISFVAHCDTQAEIDSLWERLSAGGSEGQCGWLEDRFGVSWQVVPRELERLMALTDPAVSERVMQAMLTMTRLDVEALRKAARG